MAALFSSGEVAADLPAGGCSGALGRKPARVLRRDSRAIVRAKESRNGPSLNAAKLIPLERPRKVVFRGRVEGVRVPTPSKVVAPRSEDDTISLARAELVRSVCND